MELELNIDSKPSATLLPPTLLIGDIFQDVLTSVERAKQALDDNDNNNNSNISKSDSDNNISDSEKAKIMKKHMSKLVQNLRNIKINQLLSSLLEIPDEEKQGDLYFFDVNPKHLHDSTLHAEEYRHLLRSKRKNERDVVFRIQQLLLKCATTFEKQLQHIETRQKERDTADKLGQVIRGQAEQIQILQQKLSSWRDAKTGQNKKVYELHTITEEFKSKIKTTEVEVERWKAKCERIQSQSEWTEDKMQERDTQVHDLMGALGMLKMQLNAARTRLKRTEDHAGADHAQLLEQAHASENLYSELMFKSTSELKQVQEKANQEYEELATILSREREKRIQNDARNSALIQQLQMEDSDLRKHNHDLEVTMDALRKRIADLEHEKRYGRIQRKFQLSLSKVREKKNQENDKDILLPLPPPPSPPVVLNDESTDKATTTGDGEGNDDDQDKDNTNATAPETQQPEDDDEHSNNDGGISEESTWDDAQRYTNTNTCTDTTLKREKVCMKIRYQPKIGASDMYIKALQYYRPATEHPSAAALQQMLSERIIKAARAREKKYIFGWGYFVEQYKRLVFFRTLTVESVNSKCIYQAMSYAKMNARMAKKQWRTLRQQRGEGLWNSILNDCIHLTNHINNINGFASLIKGRRRRRKSKQTNAAANARANSAAAASKIVGIDNIPVALDHVVLAVKVDPMAHFDVRTASARPHTAGHLIRSQQPLAGSSSRPPFVVPKRPSSAMHTVRPRSRTGSRQKGKRGRNKKSSRKNNNWRNSSNNKSSIDSNSTESSNKTFIIGNNSFSTNEMCS
jgi:hypothetical protein